MPDGRGALLSGGLPGNPGGPGRPSSLVRARCRGSFYERIPVLEEIADDPGISPADRIRAIEVLARYGLGANVTHALGEPPSESTGIIVLPPLELDYARRLAAGEISQENGRAFDRNGLEYVVIDEEMPAAPGHSGGSSDSGRGLDPAVVARVLARTRGEATPDHRIPGQTSALPPG